MKNQSIALSIDSKEGMFRVEKRVSFFYNHETKASMIENIVGIMKEVKKLAKNNNVTVTIESMDLDYHSTNVHRYCFNEWIYQGTVKLESRPYTGHDYGEINELNFTSIRELYKYLKSDLERHVKNIMPDIPLDGNSIYGQRLEETGEGNQPIEQIL